MFHPWKFHVSATSNNCKFKKWFHIVSIRYYYILGPEIHLRKILWDTPDRYIFYNMSNTNNWSEIYDISLFIFRLLPVKTGSDGHAFWHNEKWRIFHCKFQMSISIYLCETVHRQESDRQADRKTDGQTDRQTLWNQYTPPNFVCGGYNYCLEKWKENEESG